MPLTFIDFKGHKYPEWQAKGNAARWIIPLAKELLSGVGYDIGYSKEAWMLPGAIGIEPTIDHRYDAMRLPEGEVDYIFSSHCLEHVQRNWFDVLDYWLSKIKIGGILFLYLPHSSQVYWHPENNRKHIHSFDGSEIETYLNDLGHKVYVSPGPDFNNSFVVVCEKCDNYYIEGTKVSYKDYCEFKMKDDKLKDLYPTLDFKHGITGPLAADYLRKRFNIVDDFKEKYK